jgi:hypothetical protein
MLHVKLTYKFAKELLTRTWNFLTQLFSDFTRDFMQASHYPLVYIIWMDS